MTNRAGFYLRHKFNVTSALNAQICDSNGNRIPSASAFLFFFQEKKNEKKTIIHNIGGDSMYWIVSQVRPVEAQLVTSYKTEDNSGC